MRILIFLLITFVISSCSSFSADRPNEPSISGAGSLIDENNWFGPFGNKFSTVNYCELLHYYGLVSITDADSRSSLSQCKLNQHKAISATTRNEIQDYLIGASNQKCGEYIRLIHTMKADADFLWGSLSILLAGAGSVVEHAATAQAFSAGGAAASGIRAERNQAYFANLATEVIVAGINSRRSELLDELKSRRSDTNYTLNGAISDVIDYHSSCNAVTGFEVASDSIKRVNNPGIEEFIELTNRLESEGIQLLPTDGG